MYFIYDLKEYHSTVKVNFVVAQLESTGNVKYDIIQNNKSSKMQINKKNLVMGTRTLKLH